MRRRARHGLAVCLLVALLSAGSTAGPDDLERIRDWFDRSMYRTGGAALTTFLEKNPDSPGGLALLAELRRFEEDWAGAEAAARRAVELDLLNPRLWMLWSRIRFEQGREAAREELPRETVMEHFAHAEFGFRRVWELDPKHPDVAWWIGWTKEWTGEYGSARQFYESQIRDHPERPGGYRRLGRFLQRRAERAEDPASADAAALHREAMATFELGIEKAGEDAELLYLRAQALEQAGERERSLASLERSVLADPDFERSWSNLAKRLGGEEQLVPFAIRVLGKHPAGAHAAWLAGYHTIRRDPAPGERPSARYEQTLEYVLPALEVHGDHEELYKIALRAALALVGATPRAAVNAPKAMDAFRRIHEAYAWSGDAANNLGFFYREVRNYDESLAWYMKSVARAPENQDILNDTGLIYLFHFPREREKGLPYFLKTVALVTEGGQDPERGYWDSLENLCKHYWEVDRQPEKVVEYARMRYETTKGVKPYNMSPRSAGYAEKAKKLLAR